MDVNLTRGYQYYLGLAWADSTKAAYTSHLRSFIRFCQSYGCTPLPASNDTVCKYVVFLASKIKFTSIKKYLNIIRILHKNAGFSNPLEENFSLDMLLRGVKRAKGCPPNQKLPITPQILLLFRNTLCLDQPADVLFWVTCLLGFYGLLRKSSLLPASPGKFQPKLHPCRQDVLRTDRGLVLKIKYSKTLQFQERHLLIPLPYLQNHKLCPTSAVLTLLSYQGANLPSFSPLLALPSGAVYTQNLFVDKLRQTLRACGLPADRYSGHSFRRGSATYLFQMGMPGELIQVMGDWKSNAYKLYLDMSLETKYNMVLQFLGKLPNTI